MTNPIDSSEKQNLHPRNLHRNRYDFKVLIDSCPALKPFVSLNKYQHESVDFANPEAVKMLNRAILTHFYGINYWDIPPHYLCPPIPGRADYVHYLADLLATNNNQIIPTGQHIIGLDIGIGANCVYPIIGNHHYGWRFVGSDIDPKAIQSAQQIIQQNQSLTPFVECRLQTNNTHIFKGIVEPYEKFDFTMCNPPFHASLAEAMAGTQRKWQNLGRKDMQQKDTLNFGGQHAELWCKGGEEAFLNNMIFQSVHVAQQCLWFTSLISKKTTLPSVYRALNKVKAFDVKTIDMSQGQKVSRIVAWTFLDEQQQKNWHKKQSL